MSAIKIGYLGYGTRALDALMEHPDFEVVCFIAPKSRLCEDVYVAHEKYHQLPYITVADNNELYRVVSSTPEPECWLINACPIILKENVLSLAPFFNIHPGDLRTNRGHQPHMWTVLLGEKQSTINLHSVTPGIDEGLVIRSKTIDIHPTDNSEVVLNRLEDEIPCLLDGLRDYLRGKAEPEGEIFGGIYRRVMIHEDYEIHLSQISDPGFIDDAWRKIRARQIKHGAFFKYGESRVYVDDILRVKGSCRDTENAAAVIRFYNKRPGTVSISAGDFSVLFHINHIEPLA